MEISPLICSANQWTDFYMTGISAMKELTTAVLRMYLLGGLKSRGVAGIPKACKTDSNSL